MTALSRLSRQADLEDKLAKLEELMASQPEGCGGVPLIAATPVQLARSARMEEKTNERERLTAILKDLDDRNDLLQPVYHKVKRLPCTAHANTHPPTPPCAHAGDGHIARVEHRQGHGHCRLRRVLLRERARAHQR